MVVAVGAGAGAATAKLPPVSSRPSADAAEMAN